MYKQNPSWIFITIQVSERKLLRDARENRVRRTLEYLSGGRFSRASRNNSRSHYEIETHENLGIFFMANSHLFTSIFTGFSQTKGRGFSWDFAIKFPVKKP